LTKEISCLLFIAALLAITVPGMAEGLTIKTSRKLVIIDPGHGGNDSGITSTTGILEKQITLKLAQMTTKLIGDRHQSLLTRTTDLSLSETDRIAFANRNKATLYISLHLHDNKQKSFFFYFGTPGPTPKHSDSNWKTQGLEYQNKSKKTATLFAGFQKNNKKKRVYVGPAPAIPLEGLQMPAILIEPFAVSDLPDTTADQKIFLTPYAEKLAKSIQLYFKDTI
jgi:N-acetylmuramoyl-L-alanine amidase